MDHNWVSERMPEYQANGLSAEDRASVEEHVASCVDCASLLLAIEPVEVPEAPRGRRRLRYFPGIETPTRSFRALLVGSAMVFLAIVGVVVVELDPERARGLSPRLEEAGAGDEVSVAASVMVPQRAGNSSPKDREIQENLREIFASQSADAEEFRSMGDSNLFLSAGGYRGKPGALRLPVAYDTMGVGGGGGGGGLDASSRKGGLYSRSADAQPADFARELRAQAAQSEMVVNLPEPAPIKLPPRAQEEAPRLQRKLIRSGEMDFEIDSFDGAVATLTKIALEEQGFIATVNSEKLPNGKVRGVVVVRVPPERLDTFLLAVRALGDLKNRRIGSEDVTKAYTDLESRLRAARTMEERLIAIIKNGKGEIKDLLQAEKELGDWRTRIETMVGEINYYNNLVAHSTVTISLSEKEIRAPFALVETERVEMGLEVEDVEKAHAAALAAVAEAGGRILKSELKQPAEGQFYAQLQFEASPAKAGALRDRFKQLGALARLDISRNQEAQGGSGRPQDLKVRQNDTLFLVSIYNLANVAPRETTTLGLACMDTELAYQAVLDRVQKAAGRVLSSTMSRQRANQTLGQIRLQVKTAEAAALLADLRGLGEVVKLDVGESADPTNSTRTKRGFDITLYGMDHVRSRESTRISLASKDVAGAYHALLEAAKAAGARIHTAQLNENDRKSMTATLSFEVRRDREPALHDVAARVGDVYARASSRAADTEMVVDSKTQLDFNLFNAANIPARETLNLNVVVADVDAVVKGLETEFRGRVADARHTREESGRRESALSIDVPLKEAPAVLERLKALGSLVKQTSTKNDAVPENELSVARIQAVLSNEVLLGQDSGPWVNIKRGLALSLQAGSWALMLMMIGLCFVLPVLLVGWGLYRLRKVLAPKAVEAAPAA